MFEGYLPDHTKLTIEQTDSKLSYRYIFRVHYTSPKSNRVMCVTAKGDSLPYCNDYLFDFYLRQLVLSPREISRAFTHLRFLELRARQDEFLFGGKNTRVSQERAELDKMTYEEFV